MDIFVGRFMTNDRAASVYHFSQVLLIDADKVFAIELIWIYSLLHVFSVHFSDPGRRQAFVAMGGERVNEFVMYVARVVDAFQHGDLS